MIYASVCSGIEAATVAWHPLGWHAAFFAEIEPFPSAVLAHHYPTTPNYGDMTRYRDWPDATLDLLVGGTPCQSFSVAGLRKGLADPRGNLALVFLGILDRVRPRWVVWENVPGVLSSNGGRDVGAFLGGLAELGYGWAYRVLDARYFGVPQRRRRVFVVGHLGDWRRAAAVLFERQSLSGHPAPGRTAREGTAPTLAARVRGGGGLGTDAECDGALVPTLARCDTAREGQRQDWETETILPTLTSNGDAHGGYRDADGLVTHSLTSRYDSSDDGCGRGTPLVPIAFQESQTGCREYADAGTLRADGPGHDPVGTRIRQGMAVRRLTLRECERLQGFPDDYTLIPYRGKLARDGPRYKALGNSMAVPVMRWIGERIEAVEALMRIQAA